MPRAFVILAVGLVAIPFAQAVTGPALTAPQYRAQASSICRLAKHRLDALPTPTRSGNPSDLSAMAPFLRAGIRIEGAEIRQLQTLTPPPSLARLVTRGLAIKHQQVETFTKLVALANAGKLTISEVIAGLLQDPDSAAIWKRVGASVCQY